MTEPRTIILAGKSIDVPALPLRINLKAYPLCQKLTNAGYVERFVAAATGGIAIEVTDEEFANLAELAFLGAKAADPSLEREAFDEWPIAPPELTDAFFPIRLQTGGWIAAEAKEGQDEPGEGKGAKRKPRK